MRLEDINLRNPITIGYYDPFSVFPSIQNDFCSKFPLSNLHWKYHPLKPVKSIPLLPVRLEEEVPRTYNKNEGKQLLSLVDNVYLRVIFIKADDLEMYRSQVRPLISAWLTDLVKPDNVSWAVVLVLPGSKKEKTSTLIKTSLFDKLRNDFGRTGKRLLELQLSRDEVEFGADDETDGSQNIFKLRDSYTDDIQKLEAYTEIIGSFKSLLLQTFDRRYLKYSGELEKLKPSKDDSDLQLSEFVKKLKLAQVLNDMRFLKESLEIYEELNRDLNSLILNSPHKFDPQTLNLPTGENLNKFSPELDIDSDSLMQVFAHCTQNSELIGTFQAKLGLFLKTSVILQSLANFATSISLSSIYISSLLQKFIYLTNSISKLFAELVELNEWFCVMIDSYMKLPLTEKLMEINERANELQQTSHVTEILEYMAELKLLKRTVVTKIAISRGFHPPNICSTLEDIPLLEATGEKVKPSRPELTYEPLIEALTTQESYESYFELITLSAMRDFASCDRTKTIDILSIDLALLYYGQKRYPEALEILQNSYDYFLQNGWNFMGGILLELYLDCIEHTSSQDYENVVKSGLKLFSTLRTSDTIARGINSYNSIKSKAQKSRLYKSICESSRKSSSPLYFPLNELFDYSIDLYVFFDETKHKNCIEMRIQNQFGTEIPLENITVTLCEVNTNSDSIEFNSGITEVFSKSESSIILSTNSFREGTFQLSNVKIQVTENLFYVSNTNFQNNSADTTVIYNGDAHKSSAEDAQLQEFHMYPAPGCVRIRFVAPDKIDLHNSAVSCKVYGADHATKNLKVKLSSATSGVTFGSGSDVFQIDNLNANAVVESNIPFVYTGEDKLVELEAHCLYQDEADETLDYYIKGSYDMNLIISITVQDIFRADSIYSKFQIGSANSKIPVRISQWSFKCPNNKYDVLCLLGVFGVEDSLLIFGEQPAFLFYRIVPKSDNPSAEDTLDLTIKFTDLQKECELAVSAALERKLEDLDGRKYLYFLERTVSKLQYNLNYYGIYHKVLALNISECSSFADSIIKRCIPPTEHTKFLSLIESLFSDNELQWREDICVHEQTLYIPVGIPILRMLHLVEFVLTKKAHYVASEPIEAELVISSTTKWQGSENHEILASSSPSLKAAKAKQTFEVTLLNEDSWIISGHKRFTFDVLDEHHRESYNLTLVPLTVGEVQLPRVSIQPVFGTNKAMDVVHENGLETVLVVPEVDSVTFAF